MGSAQGWAGVGKGESQSTNGAGASCRRSRTSTASLVTFSFCECHSRIVPPPTVSERLRSLLEQASHENLSSEQQADLEQLLIAFWSQRLKLSSKRLGTMIEQLRKHPEAGRQWNRVEGWLHSGKSTTNGTVARELLHDLDTLK